MCHPAEGVTALPRVPVPSNRTGRGLGAKYLPNVSGKHAEPPTAVRHTFMLTTLEMSKIVTLVKRVALVL